MSTHNIKLPDPYGYIYVWEGPYGTHRLTAGQYNGRQCDRTIAYYTEDQVRAAIEADRKRRGEPVAQVTVNDDGTQTWVALKTQWLPKGVHTLYTTPQQQARGELVACFKCGHAKHGGECVNVAPQPAEPVAWFTEDHLTDRSSTTWDKTVAARWRDKGWPVGELFAASQPSGAPVNNKEVCGEQNGNYAPQQHPDDAAVDAFASAMKAKLAKKRADGRGNWQMCTSTYLSRLLREHVEKGDPIDVANLAMMLHQNGQRIEPTPQPQQQASAPIYQWRKRNSGPWHDAPKDDAFARIDDFYEARVLYPTPQPQQIPEDFLRSVTSLCSYRGASPSDVEGFDPEDKWIADLWRKAEAMLEAAAEPKDQP